MSWFNFRGGDQQKQVGELSGGERNRVHLAKLLKSGGNVLLLDEPTNDLDVDTLRALEEALLDFAGCAVVITHDRWFLDRVATHILAFEGDSQATWFEGTWGEYAELGDRDAGPEALEPHRIKYKPLVRALTGTRGRGSTSRADELDACRLLGARAARRLRPRRRARSRSRRVRAAQGGRATRRPELRGIRSPGTAWPGRIALGTAPLRRRQGLRRRLPPRPGRRRRPRRGRASPASIVSTRDAEAVAAEINAPPASRGAQARSRRMLESGLRDARLERGAERLADRLELDPVEDVLEEAAHDQPLGLARARGRGSSGRRAPRG